MKCPKCNKSLRNNWVYCPFCGKLLTTIITTIEYPILDMNHLDKIEKKIDKLLKMNLYYFPKLKKRCK
jgi:hypothetical protein